MSIERSSNPVAQKSVAGSEGGAHAKQRSSAATDASATTPGDFLSLLNALGSDEGGVASDEAVLVFSVVPEPLTPPAPSDAVFAQVMASSREMPRTVEGESVVEGDASSLAVRGNATSMHRAANGLARGESGVLPSAASEAVDALGLAELQTGKSLKAATSAVSKNAQTESLSASARAAVDLKELRPLPIMELATAGATKSDLMTAATLAEGGFRQVERQSEKAMARQIGGVAEGAHGPSNWFPGLRVEAPSAVINTAMPTPELMVAEQVSFWISSDVKSAELTLDGLGTEPVEVSITLHGNEAHVAFRTDQAATRDVLENAATHLKELLKSEGIVLSGMSVGTSDQHDGQASQERRPRSGMRQMSMGGAETEASTAIGRNTSGRALDLFV